MGEGRGNFAHRLLAPDVGYFSPQLALHIACPLLFGNISVRSYRAVPGYRNRYSRDIDPNAATIGSFQTNLLGVDVPIPSDCA